MDVAAVVPTLYQRLGVDVCAPQCQIRAAYIRLARQWHPDRHRGEDCGAAQRRFQEIQEAYEVLMDAQRRRAYDMQLLHLLDVEEYLSRFHELVLTVNGLGMALPHHAHPGADADCGASAGGAGAGAGGVAQEQPPIATPPPGSRMLKAS
ncbi:hypothetical protein Rsub_04876 [Raphidocelis subcapitata]|uniref:J domain-containing protein n=1 Tax=Raphidocelis subcapitata TaxID=307507 RepID=A0A2V0P1Y3_9CHLO|nr:hypothetical protein Rsub_04876 [Raphidocelis subcapitata]|eukprot:GBF91207.1 hypothetical protein Rsub_04876 [Raphidocelis subcapitata]